MLGVIRRKGPYPGLAHGRGTIIEFRGECIEIETTYVHEMQIYITWLDNKKLRLSNILWEPLRYLANFANSTPTTA